MYVATLKRHCHDGLGKPRKRCLFLRRMVAEALILQLSFHFGKSLTYVRCHTCDVAESLRMMLGSYFWGCLADTQGRKIVLVAALFLDGICGVASSISQYFGLFLFFRFLNGFGCPVMTGPTVGTGLLLPKCFTAHVKCVATLEGDSHDGLEEPRKRCLLLRKVDAKT
ncbi:unnamed protein product [Timema podura]|uniref:Uncharacterized protein n=1 Tax=Timema podura TaxID=61482 RepID=A0ABN7PG46_TIMPD|nr:unnamed protein product [Timema podura]